jgi:hypothetical protein
MVVVEALDSTIKQEKWPGIGLTRVINRKARRKPGAKKERDRPPFNLWENDPYGSTVSMTIRSPVPRRRYAIPTFFRPGREAA